MADDDFSKLFDGIIAASKQMQDNWPSADVKTERDERNELICLALYDDNWRPDGFDYVPDSTDIITHWKKEGEPKSKQVYLTFKQQRRWIFKIEQRKGIKR